MKLNGGRACESTPAGSGVLVVVLGDGSELDVVAEGFQGCGPPTGSRAALLTVERRRCIDLGHGRLSGR